jgi:hypothetical protein
MPSLSFLRSFAVCALFALALAASESHEVKTASHPAASAPLRRLASKLDATRKDLLQHHLAKTIDPSKIQRRISEAVSRSLNATTRQFPHRDASSSANCSNVNYLVAATIGDLIYEIPNMACGAANESVLDVCYVTSECLATVQCWLCEYVPTAVAADFNCTLCPCLLFAGQWSCPSPTAGPFPQVPEVFGPDASFPVSWYYSVGQLNPVNPSLAPLGFEFTLFQLNSVAGVVYSGATSFALNFAITNPNAPPPYGYLRGVDPAEFFPPTLVNMALDPTTGGLSVTSFPTAAEQALYSVTHTFNLSTSDVAAGIRNTKWFINATSVAPFPSPQGTIYVPMAITLHLIDTKGAVLQGNQGVTTGGYLPCSTDVYVSMSHLELDPTQLSFVVAGDTIIPLQSGVAWMDRELTASSLEDFNGGHATCWGNGVNAVNLAAVASGQQPVLNATGWIWTNIHVPELDLEFTLTQMSDVLLSTLQSGLSMHQFYQGVGSWGTCITGSNVSTGLANKIDLTADNIGITILATQPFYAFDVLNTSQAEPAIYYPTAVQFHVQHPLVTLDVVCQDVSYTSTQTHVLQNFFDWAGASNYMEGLMNCAGLAVYFGSQPVQFSLQTNFWGYLERRVSPPSADRPCTCPNGLT